jgi:uncharacterized protein (DUF1501 family)
MSEPEFPDILRALSVPSPFSRRNFMKGAGVIAGGVALTPYLSKLEAFASPPIGPSDGVLVVIQMGGGNDGLDTFIPVGDPRYYALRATANYPAAQTLPIAIGFGFHPALVKLKARYDAGKVAIVQGVGNLPVPDLSHFSSTATWMQGWGGSSVSGAPTGWLGRFLDGLPNAANEPLRGATISSSVPLHLVGVQARAAGLPESISGAFGLDRRYKSDAAMFDAFGGFGGSSGLGPWGDAAGKSAADTMTVAAQIQPAYVGAMPSSDLARQLVTCARLINADLGIRVLNVTIGGFDNHTNLAGDHTSQLAELDDAIESFFATLAATFASRVALMTFSEFGRRAGTNSDGGADHGTAGTHFIVGDEVNGGLYGAQPSLAANALDGNGNLVSTVDFRQYYATVLNDWLAADPTQILGRSYTSLGVFRGLPGAAPPAPATPPVLSQTMPGGLRTEPRTARVGRIGARAGTPLKRRRRR